MANRFDVVLVQTNDESCMVVRVGVRAAILGHERQMKMRRLTDRRHWERLEFSGEWALALRTCAGPTDFD